MSKKALLAYIILFFIFFFPYLYMGIQICSIKNTGVLNYLFANKLEIATLATNTFWKCSGSASFAVLIGLILGFFLFRTNFHARKCYILCTIIAIAIPMHVQISTWLGALGRNGILTPFIQFICPDFSIYNLYGVAWISGWAYAPLATICCGHMFVSVHSKCESEAYMHLKLWDIFFCVLLPILKRNIFILWLFIFFISFGEVTVTDVLGIHNTLTQKIYLLFNIYYQPELALFLCLPCFAIIIIALFLFFKLFHSQNIWSDYFNKQLYSLKGIYSSIVYLFTSCIICIFWLSIPVLIYITHSFSKWIVVFHSIKQEIFYSFSISMVVGIITTLLALPLAWHIARKKIHFFFVIIGCWLIFTPAPVTGIAIVRVANMLSALPVIGDFFYAMQDSILMVEYSLISKFLPFAVLLIYLEITHIPKKWEEIACLEGYSPTQTLFSVLFPLLKKRLIFTVVAISILALGEVIISILVVPPGTTTLSIRILTLLHNGARADVSAASLWLILFIAIISFCGGLAIKFTKDLSDGTP